MTSRLRLASTASQYALSCQADKKTLCEGHTVSFFRDIEGTINHARFDLTNIFHERLLYSFSTREYFINTSEPLAFTIAGKTVYVLVSVHDIYAAQKAVDNFNHDISTTDFMDRFGVTKAGLKVLFEDPSPSLLRSKTLEPNPSAKHMTHLGAAFFVTQLVPGKTLENIQGVALHLIAKKLTPESILDGTVSVNKENSTHVRAYLLKWTSRTLVESTTTALFGPALLRMDPSLVTTFLQFDDNI